jgi:hypothetical protein
MRWRSIRTAGARAVGRAGADWWRQGNRTTAIDALGRGADDKLLNAVCDVIDPICDNPGERRARAEQLRTASGSLSGSSRTFADDWVALFRPHDQFADITTSALRFSRLTGWYYFGTMISWR